MSTISKVFTVINVVLALFLLGSVSAILAESADYRAKLAVEQKAHSDTKTQLEGQVAETRGKNDNLSKENGRLVESEGDLKQELQAVKAERDQLRNDTTELRNSVSGINANLSALTKQVQDYESRNKDLATKNQELRDATATAQAAQRAAEEDRARLEGEVARLNQDLSGSQEQLAALTLDRDNLVAQMEALAAQGVDVVKLIGNAVQKIDGTVSAVGEGFVVLSVGENDGVRVGYPFDVYRGGDYIGRVVVTDVLPDNCTARVAYKNKSLKFSALDKATTRL